MPPDRASTATRCRSLVANPGEVWSRTSSRTPETRAFGKVGEGVVKLAAEPSLPGGSNNARPSPTRVVRASPARQSACIWARRKAQATELPVGRRPSRVPKRFVQPTAGWPGSYSIRRRQSSPPWQPATRQQSRIPRRLSPLPRAAEDIAGRRMVAELAVKLHRPVDFAGQLKGPAAAPPVIEIVEEWQRCIRVEAALEEHLGCPAIVVQQFAMNERGA